MISVIIPLYNKEKIIERTLQSVLTQGYDDYEVIVVNDGSTDRSVEIVNSIYDSRIRLIDQENGGPSKARNTGVKNSTGDWIVFLDADDEFLPGALSHFNNLISNHPGIKMFGCSYVVNNGKRTREVFHINEGYYKKFYKTYFFEIYNYRTGCTVIHREIVEKCPFNEQLRRFEDLECFTRMQKYGGVYLSSFIVLQQNTLFNQACLGRNDISEDFIGHLDFKGKSFWEKMCLYRLFLWERNNYSKQCKEFYPSLYKRLDLYLLYQFFKKTRNLWLSNLEEK